MITFGGGHRAIETNVLAAVVRDSITPPRGRQPARFPLSLAQAEYNNKLPNRTQSKRL